MGSYKIFNTKEARREKTTNSWSKQQTNSNMVGLNPTRFKSNLNTDNYIK